MDPALARAAEALDFAAYDGERLAFHRNAYTSAMAAVDAMRTSGAFRQLRRFVNRFALLSRRSFRDAATAALGTAAAAAGPGDDDDGDEEDGGKRRRTRGPGAARRARPAPRRRTPPRRATTEAGAAAEAGARAKAAAGAARWSSSRR